MTKNDQQLLSSPKYLTPRDEQNNILVDMNKKYSVSKPENICS